MTVKDIQFTAQTMQLLSWESLSWLYEPVRCINVFA